MNESMAKLKQMEIDELRKRLEILEADRSTFADLTPWRINQNEENIASLRKENKELRKKITESAQQKQASTKQNNQLAQEYQKILQSQFELRNKLNELVAMRADYEAKIDLLSLEKRDMGFEAQKGNEDWIHFQKMHKELDRRIAKVYGKTNEAQGIGKKYEVIFARLKHEQVLMNERAEKMEKMLKNMESDARMVSGMIIEAQHAKEATKIELARLVSTLEKEKASREHIIMEKKIYIKRRGQVGNTPEQEKKHMSAIDAQDIPEATKQEYKRAALKLHQETGASDIAEVIEKLLAQNDTYARLYELKEDGEAKLEALAEQKSQLRNKLEDLRYSIANAEEHRALLNSIDEKYVETGERCAEWKSKYETVTKISMEIRLGIEQLADSVDPFNAAPVTEENIIEVFEGIVSKASSKLASIESEKQRLIDIGIESNESLESKLNESLQRCQSANRRVRIYPSLAESSDSDESGDDSDSNRELSKQSISALDTAKDTGKDTSKGAPKDTAKEAAPKDPHLSVNVPVARSHGGPKRSGQNSPPIESLGTLRINTKDRERERIRGAKRNGPHSPMEARSFSQYLNSPAGHSGAAHTPQHQVQISH